MSDPTLRQRRRANLLAWMESHGLNQTDVSNRIKKGRAYVSNLLLPERAFGEKAARYIEGCLVMPSGWLDSDHSRPEAVAAWSRVEDLPDGVFALVPRVDVRLSAGPGSVPMESTLPPLAFREDWLRRKGVTSRASLRVCEVAGDSMEPYLMDGDVVLVDTGQADLVDGDVYAVRIGEEVRIKRLFRRLAGSPLLKSDNPNFPEETIAPESMHQLQVLGRVLWRSG